MEKLKYIGETIGPWIAFDDHVVVLQNLAEERIRVLMLDVQEDGSDLETRVTIQRSDTAEIGHDCQCDTCLVDTDVWRKSAAQSDRSL